MNTTTVETIIRTLQEHNVPPDESFVAAAGHDWGYVAAWQLPKGDYVILYGDNGETNYTLTEDGDGSDIDDLACWLLPGGDGSDAGKDAPVVIANIRGVEVVKKATPEDEGPFRVLKTSYYYGPTEKSDWLYDYDPQSPYEYDTYQEAEDAISAEEDGVYTLSHNEYSSPTHTIIQA